MRAQFRGTALPAECHQPTRRIIDDLRREQAGLEATIASRCSAIRLFRSRTSLRHGTRRGRLSKKCAANACHASPTQHRAVQRHDVVIVGGGVVVCATVYFLNQTDPACDVAVIEPDSTYAFASSRSIIAAALRAPCTFARAACARPAASSMRGVREPDERPVRAPLCAHPPQTSVCGAGHPPGTAFRRGAPSRPLRPIRDRAPARRGFAGGPQRPGKAFARSDRPSSAIRASARFR